MECKFQYDATDNTVTAELIDTLWNVNNVTTLRYLTVSWN